MRTGFVVFYFLQCFKLRPTISYLEQVQLALNPQHRTLYNNMQDLEPLPATKAGLSISERVILATIVTILLSFTVSLL